MIDFNKPKSRRLTTVITCGVQSLLSEAEIQKAIAALQKERTVPDPDNPGLWRTQIGLHTIWGVLDEGAGVDGEDILTVLLLC